MLLNRVKLKALFNDSNISLSAIAIRLNIDKSTLSRILNGKNNAPHPDTINSIAKYFGVDVIELYDDIVHVKPNGQSPIRFKNTKDTLNYLIMKSGIINVTNLSNHTGIPRANIERILSGKTESPSVKTLSTLAEFFDVSIDQLLGKSPISGHKAFNINVDNKVNIPLINISDSLNWVIGIKEINIIKYIKTDLHNISDKCFAIQQENSILVIDPSQHPKSDDTILALANNKIGIHEYFGLNNKATLIGTIIQEVFI